MKAKERIKKPPIKTQRKTNQGLKTVVLSKGKAFITCCSKVDCGSDFSLIFDWLFDW